MSLFALLVTTGAWAFAEAIVWFIVADVPISLVAVRFGTRQALLAAVIASLASVAGGAGAYIWSDLDPGSAIATMALLPAISPAMIGEAAAAYDALGWRAMLEASFSGMPYKLFPVTAARDGHALLPMLVATPFVRLPRFVVVALLVGVISRLVQRRLDLRARLGLLAAAWLLFYAVYFAIMPA